MKNLINFVFRNEAGYGVVELLIIVAALGLLASVLMGGLQVSLTGKDGEGGATGVVGEKVIDILDRW